MSAILIDSVRAYWKDNFNGEAVLVGSPGRINLIGEHTDYNEGYVLPAAIDKSIAAAFSPSGSELCRVQSIDTGRELRFSLAGPPIRFPHGAWENYVIGVACELKAAGYDPGGFNMAFGGDIPQGAGLSSSAALENAVAFGLDALFNLGLPKEEMIRIGQRAEHNFAGVHCGIMDQYASMFGRQGYALLLDCRSLRSVEKELALGDCELWLANSNVKHSLAEAGYNKRREECQAGVAILREIWPDIRALRDVSQTQLEQAAEYLPPVIFDRCAYVVKENLRVLQAVIALTGGDHESFGSILLEAHHDMRYLYEITCPEIDHLVDAVSGHPDMLGCRMMGGGFGGCTLNLIRAGSAASIFDERFRENYRRLFNHNLELYKVRTGDGTGLIGY